jgi:hypothetical protein
MKGKIKPNKVTAKGSPALLDVLTSVSRPEHGQPPCIPSFEGLNKGIDTACAAVRVSFLLIVHLGSE